ncbi:MAG: DNA-directed RNA polymerase subunit omega [Bacillota bacterium]|nr:DNA-directed RNA polymerase subunit omega [Bacillota bacterium]
MIYPAIDQLMKKFDSRYSLVVAVSKRARELEDEDVAPLIESKSEKPVSIAVEEFYEGKLKYTH